MLLHSVPWINAPNAIQETTTTEAEARNIEKYRELKDIAYISQSLAMEVQGYLDESSEIFITRLCKKFVVRTTINEVAAFWSNGSQCLSRSAMQPEF